MDASNENIAKSHVAADQGAVETLMLDPATHRGAPVQRIDTAISVVFLVGDTAYKMKKAVRFPFLDWSALKARRAACLQEIAVNRENAPSIYRDVIAVTRAPDGSLRLCGDGEPVEYLVRMNRFDENATLDHVVARCASDDQLCFLLAQAVAHAHWRAPLRDVQPWVADLSRYLDQNRVAFLEAPRLFAPERVHDLDRRARAALNRLEALLEERGRLGLCRRIHGDLHAANIAVLNGAPTLFDAIEFDDGIATGDILYDLAFLLMDLDHRGARVAADHVLNWYNAEFARREWTQGEATGRVPFSGQLTQGLAALPFFMSLRAAIRAKATAAKLPYCAGDERDAVAADAIAYFDAASAYLDPVEPVLVAVGGLSGTGKSSVADEIGPRLGASPGAQVYRTDVVRKYLSGAELTQRLPAAAYDKAVTERVYKTVIGLAHTALAAGRAVVADAVFAAPEERAEIERVAAICEIKFVGLWLEAGLDTRVERVDQRVAAVSDADAGVARKQQAYEIGEMTWHRIDSGRPLSAVVDEVFTLLRREGVTLADL